MCSPTHPRSTPDYFEANPDIYIFKMPRLRVPPEDLEIPFFLRGKESGLLLLRHSAKERFALSPP